MALFRKTKKQQTAANRRKRLGTSRTENFRQLINRDTAIDLGIYALFASLIILICFYGLSPVRSVIRPDQVARSRVVADLNFSYVSEIETNILREEQRRRVPPVYRIDTEGYEAFKGYLTDLIDQLTEYTSPPEGAPINSVRVSPAEIGRFISAYAGGNPFALSPDDLSVVMNELSVNRRQEAVREGLIILGEIYRQGILDASQSSLNAGSEQMSLFNVHTEVGPSRPGGMLTQEDALRSLRIHLAALDVPRAASVALFRMLRDGLQPNLVFDVERSQERIAAAMATLRPVQVDVREGETIIEPNIRVTPLQYERYEAFRQARAESDMAVFDSRAIFWERTILTFIIVFGAALYLETTRIRIARKRRLVLLSAAIILFNMLLIRMVLGLGETVLAETNPTLLYLLPYMLPIAIGPMIITILVGSAPAVLAAGLIGIINAMMQGNSLVVLVSSHIVALIGIYFCRNIQVRTRVVKAGFFSGLTFAVAVMFLGLRDSLEVTLVLWQVLTAAGVGLLTGIIVVGLLPIWEGLFRYTTDITLLELTDYNHPLLRKLQVEASGSYHHSLMVANLSENAAGAIGANPLICRVCALFHDIGKMVKPDYYVENQREGYNPHIERNPSMSALVIKSHVKEGIVLARQYKLPRIIQDVIQQHHGTSLIQYFYYKALEKQKAADSELNLPNAPRIELDKVNEGTYRYEGPKPQFIESAIIMLADSIEAAGRTLRKATPQSIAELVDKIVTSRLEDGQLDETPITLEQLSKVKESFVNTLLSMLHSRVEYPEASSGESGGGIGSRRPGRQRSTSPFAATPEPHPSRPGMEPEIVGDLLPAENSPESRSSSPAVAIPEKNIPTT